MPLIVTDWAARAGVAASGFLDRFGLRPGSNLQEMGRGYASLVEQDARHAFINTVRAVIDAGGQKVSAMDRIYLAERMPVLIIWGDRDPIIPVEHGRRAHEEIPHSHLVEIPGARHWPQLDQPRLVCSELTRFIDETEPFVFDLDYMRQQLRQGPPAG
jgi:pimeloyl-ACP methyl ester carboxylesterase